VTLAFKNTGDAAAVFHVYDQLKLDAMPNRQPIPVDPVGLLAFRDGYPMPRRYMVEPGKVLDDVWAVQAENGGRYDLWVLGPNGFHRRFKGDLAALRGRHAAEPEVTLDYGARSGVLRLEARNDGASDVVLKVRSNKLYGALRVLKGDGWPAFFKPRGAGTEWELRLDGRERQSLSWDLDSTGGWYDLIVTSDADRTFVRRFAGRMETGAHSVSDPAMGLTDRF
jgi:phospholipase C